MMKNFSFKIRAVQLDLARQMETQYFIKNFIDFIADNGFNLLLLYLEDRVRTASYSYPADSECYTTDQMREVVGYAANRGIDVVPCISLLGHAERFLRHPELVGLAELRNGGIGRFGQTGLDVFCPSNPAVYEFFEKYLAEICAIFPSEYFHMGMDEAWSVGYCETCAPQAAVFEGEQRLFLHAINQGYRILRRLGKRVMMWDDMFEYYRDILPEAPRDLIMVNWQYQPDVRHQKGHFIDSEVGNRLALYERLGFQYLIAPSDFCSSNVRTFTEYAAAFQPLGGLLTCWEKSKYFMHKSLPVFAYAGRLWSGMDDAAAWRGAMKYLFDIDAPLLYYAVRSAVENEYNRREIELNPNTLLGRSFFGLDYGDAANIELLHRVVLDQRNSVTAPLGQLTLEDIAAELDTLRLANALRILFQKAVDHGWNAAMDQPLEEMLTRLKNLRLERLQFWHKVRNGLFPDSLDAHYREVETTCREQADLLRKGSRLRIRFCLPSQYGAPRCTISLRENGQWQTVVDGVFKANRIDHEALYERVFPVDPGWPDAVKIEVKGYGGQGICHVSYQNSEEILEPETVELVSGTVSHPEHVLCNDARWCWLGNPDTRLAFTDRRIPEQISALQITLNK